MALSPIDRPLYDAPPCFGASGKASHAAVDADLCGLLGREGSVRDPDRQLRAVGDRRLCQPAAGRSHPCRCRAGEDRGAGLPGTPARGAGSDPPAAQPDSQQRADRGAGHPPPGAGRSGGRGAVRPGGRAAWPCRPGIPDAPAHRDRPRLPGCRRQFRPPALRADHAQPRPQRGGAGGRPARVTEARASGLGPDRRGDGAGAAGQPGRSLPPGAARGGDDHRGIGRPAGGRSQRGRDRRMARAQPRPLPHARAARHRGDRAVARRDGGGDRGAGGPAGGRL